jgi:type I restriction enzyme S subunit
MDVKPGYKQTEVGVFPEDWESSELGGVLKSMQLGGNYRNSERETSWPLIKMGNLDRGSIRLDKLEFIDPSQTPAVRDRLRKDDVLFNTRNTLDLVGKVSVWSDELPEAYFNSNIMRMEFDETLVSNRFMSYILNTHESLKILRGMAIGTTSVAAIYSRDLVKLRFPLPPKAEQEAIAGALSDADAFTESLEQLLAKKRQVKQGAMQELLTGRKRLPGFSGEWEVMRLEKLATFYKGKGLPRSALDPFGSEECVHYGELFTKYPETITKIKSRTNFAGDVFRSKSNDVLMPTSDVTPNGLAKASCILQDGVVIGGDVLVIRPDRCVLSGSFLSSVIRQSREQVLQLVTGTTVFHLYGSDMKKFSLSIPPSIEEQHEIVRVLDDMEGEMAALKAKLAKARQIKQGMMQDLLTGRIRLV